MNCKGCDKPIGRQHDADCPYHRSICVNSMQAKIAPIRRIIVTVVGPYSVTQVSDALPLLPGASVKVEEKL